MGLATDVEVAAYVRKRTSMNFLLLYESQGTMFDCLHVEVREVALRMRTISKYRNKRKALNDSCKYLRPLSVLDAAFLSASKVSKSKAHSLVL